MREEEITETIMMTSHMVTGSPGRNHAAGVGAGAETGGPRCQSVEAGTGSGGR